MRVRSVGIAQARPHGHKHGPNRRPGLFYIVDTECDTSRRQRPPGLEAVECIRRRVAERGAPLDPAQPQSPSMSPWRDLRAVHQAGLEVDERGSLRLAALP